MIYTAVGCTCELTLGNGFNALNGKYYVSLEMTFKDAVASGVDFVSALYTPAGKTSADYNTDYASYADDMVLVCSPVSDRTKSYYIPTSVLLAPPDPTVKTYYRRLAVIDLGIQEDPNTLQPLIAQLGAVATAQTGILNCIMLNAVTASPVYMTDTEYQAYQVSLAANLGTVTNSVKEVISLKKQLADATAQLAVTQQTLAQFLINKEATTS